MSGSGSHPKVKKNEILETTGPGIYSCIGTAPQIMENIFKKNRIGIYIESGEPLIFNNEIKNCFESAVVFTTVGDSGCGGEISMCIIRENEENGIVVKGLKCSPRIHANPDISLCRLSGIKVIDRAYPTISNNVIKNNLAQGILLVEGSSAHIIKNVIEENMKANIALGGILSGDTVIERNTIVRGRAEGIFMIEGEHAIIMKNIIKENMDGILLSSASPLLTHNEIVDNRRCGVIMVGQCNPKVCRNSIIKNYACGILVRQNSLGVIEKNEVIFLSFSKSCCNAYNNKFRLRKTITNYQFMNSTRPDSSEYGQATTWKEHSTRQYQDASCSKKITWLLLRFDIRDFRF